MYENIEILKMFWSKLVITHIPTRVTNESVRFLYDFLLIIDQVFFCILHLDHVE